VAVRVVDTCRAIGTAERSELICRGFGNVGIRAELAQKDVLVIAYLREGAWAKDRQSDDSCEEDCFGFHNLGLWVCV